MSNRSLIQSKQKSKSKGLAGYAQLKTRVRETIALGKRRVDVEKARTYWRVGQLMHKFVLRGRDRAVRGKYVIANLSRDLHINRTQLYYSL